MSEDFIVETVFGTFIIEDYGDEEYDVATNLVDSGHYYHIPKGMTKVEIQNYFNELEAQIRLRKV